MAIGEHVVPATPDAAASGTVAAPAPAPPPENQAPVTQTGAGTAPEGDGTPDGAEPWSTHRTDMDEAALRKAHYHAERKMGEVARELAEIKAAAARDAAIGAGTGAATPPAQNAVTTPTDLPRTETGAIDFELLYTENPGEFNRILNSRVAAAPSVGAVPAVAPAPAADADMSKRLARLEIEQKRANLVQNDPEFRVLATECDKLLSEPQNAWMWTAPPGAYLTAKNFVKAKLSAVERQALTAKAKEEGAREEAARRDVEARATVAGAGASNAHTSDGQISVKDIFPGAGKASIASQIVRG